MALAFNRWRDGCCMYLSLVDRKNKDQRKMDQRNKTNHSLRAFATMHVRLTIIGDNGVHGYEKCRDAIRR